MVARLLIGNTMSKMDRRNSVTKNDVYAMFSFAYQHAKCQTTEII